jgi:hypothetical protein
VLSGYWRPIQRTERFAGIDGVRPDLAPGLQRCELEERRRLRRNRAKAQHGAAAIAMLVVRAAIGRIGRRSDLLMRVGCYLVTTMTVLMVA